MSWLKSAVNKSVEASGKHNLIRTVRNYADTVGHNACPAVPGGAKILHDREHWLITAHKCGNPRQLSVFNEFSKQLKGEAKSNQEFQRSIKDLNEKLGVVKEDLKARTRKTTEKLHKSVDDAWIEAETTSKKVAENVKEKLTAAKEEVKETLGLGTQETSGSSHTSTSSDSFRVEDGDSANARSECSQGYEANNSQEQAGVSDTLFGRFRMKISSVSPKFSLAFQKLQETKIHDLAKKGYDMIRDELSNSPSRRRRMRYTATSASSDPRSARTDIVIVPSKQSPLGEKWETFKRKVQSHPIYKRVRGISEPVVAKGQEIAEDVRETLETSDHPFVHKIIDLNEAVFGENATALSFKEIRRRDPTFSLPEFVQEVQEMIRPVLTAYYKGDIETLKKTCSSEVIERCKGERMAYESQGIYFDNKILHISEVDVRETKMMGSTPIIVLAFQTQQIYCVRDRQGSITSGGQDTIQTVYYGWAMQLVDTEELGEGAYYPVWRLREMQQLGVQALI
ncbi:mitochondrial import inner membrane translocase subunit TIM44-2 [Dendrobium catenatum]|uniref:Mitochondrial import inner membrane translocase subunit TIM44-2 n=1 Tax=Dendrobium catenatum TaxID=906689 RepID=A0A2I0WTD3_9ASPA|nr:mitochondrial import inner membrane translocase subunit TIM44-2 [Dendrobium catenatum]PKU78917.1 Mitochondrial import inner membrane translocase subunit TIM44-2 [Dendrobium catenatum]